MMASIVKQRDLIATLKKETRMNVGILNRLHPMSTELYRHVFKENGLEKPTQNQFNHLSHYLVNIIEPQIGASLSWPLYDTKTERAYRNELSNFINNYSSKGLLTPIMSSYLVNPSCYKVTVLTFQLSHLAIKRVLEGKMNKDRQKKLYNQATEKYKSNEYVGFIDYIETETHVINFKFSNYITKRCALEKIAELFRDRISSMEAKLAKIDAVKYLNDLVMSYTDKHCSEQIVTQELSKVSNIKESCGLFDIWLYEMDTLTSQIEDKWDELSIPLLKAAKSASDNSKSLIGRQTGEVDRSTFMLEYNPETDLICTKELQSNVNSEQKYILKNIEKDNRLSFPNLVRSYVIAICYILKNNMIGEEIFKFNEYLDSGLKSYSEMTCAMGMVNERVLNAEAKLEVVPANLDQSLLAAEHIEIPPLPDLSSLKTHRDSQILFDTYTPLGLSKHQFNLGRKSRINFSKPQSKATLVTQFSLPRDDFLKTLISCRVSTYDRPDATQNLHNMSIISNINKANETIAECSSGFTKQQISRLLSTKKTSSSKKFKYKTDRPNISIKKGGLFNESISSNESSGLFRSYSSPNLFENRERRHMCKVRARKLSIMKEDSPNSILEMSGIAVLDTNTNASTPQSVCGFENLKLNSSIERVAPNMSDEVNNVFSRVQIDLDKEISNNSLGLESVKSNSAIDVPETSNMETPKTNTHLIRKTSSLEKIINRFKKVRANVVSDSLESQNIKTILEEKENNFNIFNADVLTANKVLLPDLISPSLNVLKTVGNCYGDFCLDIDDEVQPRRPRESLGTVLGVDHTFLDQCDFID